MEVTACAKLSMTPNSCKLAKSVWPGSGKLHASCTQEVLKEDGTNTGNPVYDFDPMKTCSAAFYRIVPVSKHLTSPFWVCLHSGD